MESLAILFKEFLKIWCPMAVVFLLILITISVDEISRHLFEISTQECTFKE